MKFKRNVVNTARPTYQPRYQMPARTIRWRLIIMPIIYAIILLAVIYLLLFSSLVRISKITISGNTTIPEAEIQHQLDTILSSTMMGRNILFINTSNLSQQLMDQNHQLSSATINRKFIHELSVKVGERQPSLGWKTGNSLYILGEDGRAFSEQNQDATNLPIVTDSTNLPVKLGDKVAPSSFVDFVRSVYNKLPQLNLVISSVSVPESTSELNVALSQNYFVKFDTTRSLDDQLTDLKAVLVTLAKQKKKPSEYIDLRINGKVFYK